MTPNGRFFQRKNRALWYLNANRENLNSRSNFIFFPSVLELWKFSSVEFFVPIWPLNLTVENNWRTNNWTSSKLCINFYFHTQIWFKNYIHITISDSNSKKLSKNSQIQLYLRPNDLFKNFSIKHLDSKTINTALTRLHKLKIVHPHQHHGTSNKPNIWKHRLFAIWAANDCNVSPSHRVNPLRPALDG